MSAVYPTSYPGSPSSQTPPALAATNKSHAGKPVITQNGRHGSFSQRKDSTYSSMGRPSFSGFSAFGGGMAMSRQGSHASLAPSDGTVRQTPSGVHRRGTAMTMGTQYTASGTHRSLGKQQKRPSDGTWATMDPDEVFRRLNVAEVKRVEAQLRYVSVQVEERSNPQFGTAIGPRQVVNKPNSALWLASDTAICCCRRHRSEPFTIRPSNCRRLFIE